MYQGKFDAKAKGQSAPGQTLENILKERDEANAKRAAKKAALDAARPARKAPAEKKAPDQRQAPAENTAPAKKRTAPAKSEAVSENQKTQAPRKKGPRMGGVIFYTIYFLFIFAFFIGVLGFLNWLHGWLEAYEGAQPTVKCQQVFDELFGNPDWAQLYRLAGVEDTDFEGVNEYVSYMENKVGGQELNFVETSAGLSGDKKYIVRLGTEKLATFTLTGQGERITDIPDWQLGDVELFFSRNNSIQIKKLENHVAYVNGVPLDDSYTIQIASTKADELLPVGTPSVRTSIQRIDGLLAVPQIVVYDETGTSQVEVVYNPDTDTYEEMNDAIVISDEERAAVFGALEAYSGFMINASGSRAGVAKYFDGSSSTYSDIIKMGSELWMNSDNGHEFQNEEILGYTKYSDSLFSVRASLNMHVKCKDGTEKDYGVTESMIFIKKNGNWVCSEMTNADITQPVGQVRLTFCDASGNTISSDFYDTDASMLTTPTIPAPEGKTFSGWSRIDVGEDNTSTWTIVFNPDENGNVYLNGATLEPMTLYPLFE